ncbi:hypothetical protein GCM10007382_07770 [Salinibacterium xinjiangense]|nr:hypothetical protein GCM10007382_07770 [Salinibacterium xinjiangense]
MQLDTNFERTSRNAVIDQIRKGGLGAVAERTKRFEDWASAWLNNLVVMATGSSVFDCRVWLPMRHRVTHLNAMPAK